MHSIKKWFVIIVFCIFISVAAATSAPARDPFSPAIISTKSISQPLRTQWISLYFAKAKSVAAFLSSKQTDILSPQGKIHYDQRSNQIWIKDTAQHLLQARSIISHLDKSEPQFLIQAKIINIDRQYQQALGVLFQTQNNSTNSAVPLSLSEPTVSSDAGQFTISIAKLAGNHLLNMQISALEQEGHANLISSPSLMTLNNKPAVIESGAEVPYQKATSSGATSVSFKKAVLRLKVTPLRMPNHHILLHIELNQDKVSALTVNGVPAIETQQITTQVVVKDHQTIVLGGILETTQAHQIAGIPVADKLPLVGGLFRRRVHETKQEKLLIFITPSEINQ